MGVPRSGSTLSCSILNKYINTLALLEPMEPSKIDSKLGKYKAVKYINDFIIDTRNDVLNFSRVQTRHKDGVIPTNPLSNKLSKELRKNIVKVGKIDLVKEYNKDFTLIIKHNALFTALVDELSNFFTCYGIIRNPLSVLSSWNSVDLPVNDGHIPAGEKFDNELKKKLSLMTNKYDRQIVILNWFFSKFDKYLKKDNIIKYEDIIETNGKVFDSISYSAISNDIFEELSSKNNSNLYKYVNIDVLYEKLINSEGLYWKYYTKKSVDVIYNDIKNFHSM